VHREFREEYDIEIRVLETLGVFDHILLEEQEHWISVTFIARHVRGIPRIVEPTKSVGISWHPLSALPEPLSKISEDNYKSYLEKYSLQDR
jgi:ADP-ribose pyrophosphatase YjhB (NUDIX family)